MKRHGNILLSEIMNYSLNNIVWKYIEMTKKRYKDIGFDEYMIPFSGFPRPI